MAATYNFTGMHHGAWGKNGVVGPVLKSFISDTLKKDGNNKHTNGVLFMLNVQDVHVHCSKYVTLPWKRLEVCLWKEAWGELQFGSSCEVLKGGYVKPDGQLKWQKWLITHSENRGGWQMCEVGAHTHLAYSCPMWLSWAYCGFLCSNISHRWNHAEANMEFTLCWNCSLICR